MKKGKIYVLLASIFFSSIISANGQRSDSSLTLVSVNNAVEVYHQKMQKTTGLYNGSEYEEYTFGFQEGSPYFGPKDSVAGSILYDGVLYKNIFMKYDELKDQLVIWYNNDAVRLSNEKISNFKIRDHVFNRIVKDNQSKNLVSTGFYEQLYSGRTTVFKKTVKAIQQKTDVNDGVLRFIDQKTYFYLYTSRGYFQINNKADVIEALADHKNQVKDFIGSNNLSYKKDPDDFLVKVAAYYDTL